MRNFTHERDKRCTETVFRRGRDGQGFKRCAFSTLMHLSPQRCGRLATEGRSKCWQHDREQSRRRRQAHVEFPDKNLKHPNQG